MARPRKFDETRVIGAAMDAFWRRGYEATSTRDLSEGTGLGPSSLYNTFGDKRQLYLRALRWYYETATEAQIEILQRPGPVKERLRELMLHDIDVEVDTSGTGRPAGCFAINAAIEMASSDPDVKEQVHRHFARVEEALRDAVARGQRAGEIRTDRDAASLARQVLSTYYGLHVLSRAHDDRQVLADVVEGALATL
ncbi:TetR/AcrR family transcriptional regulator [Streptomyces sp. NPDC001407]|uniref:TetR/AcrR family transcriptional regulator n=1 Tax=unclassified Streptomyces TaxID=2593676 RepID=UPI00340B5FE5